MSLQNCIEHNRKKAVIHLLEIKHLKNPEQVESLGNGVYKHINTRGQTKLFKVYNTFKAYIQSEDYTIGKMLSVNGFKIVEKVL